MIFRTITRLRLSAVWLQLFAFIISSLSIGQACSQPMLAIDVTSTPGPVDPGDQVQVIISMSQLGGNQVAGFQAFLEFDQAELQFVSGGYFTAPFGLPVITPVTAVNGTIDLAAGINPLLGQSPTSADASLAVLEFIAVSGGCDVMSVAFREHKPPTRLTDALGAEIANVMLVNRPQPICPPDLVRDGMVNVDDLLQVINHWGDCPPTPVCCGGDVNQSESVDVDDLLAVINAWGACQENVEGGGYQLSSASGQRSDRPRPSPSHYTSPNSLVWTTPLTCCSRWAAPALWRI